MPGRMADAGRSPVRPIPPDEGPVIHRTAPPTDVGRPPAVAKAQRDGVTNVGRAVIDRREAWALRDAALSEIAHLLVGQRSPERVIEAVAEALRPLVPYDTITVYRSDNPLRVLRPVRCTSRAHPTRSTRRSSRSRSWSRTS